MEDLGTGEYAGGFSAMAAGAYSVSVTFQGTHIAGSPFAAEASRSHKVYQHASQLGQNTCSARTGVTATTSSGHVCMCASHNRLTARTPSMELK